MSDFASQLVATKPREIAGSRSANRFDYQLNWALCRVLELHTKNEDYVLIIDYHEDIVILNSEDNPDLAQFIQIKTKSHGNWTLDALVKQEVGINGNLPSMLGKLYTHFLSWHPCVSALIFVSNAPLSTHRKGKKRSPPLDTASFDTLSSTIRSELEAAMTKEHGPATDSSGLKLFNFQQCDMPIKTHSIYALGIVADFLEKNSHTKHVPAPAFYRTLKDEMSRAFHCEAAPNSFAELCHQKGISRTRLEKAVTDACEEPTRQNLAEQIARRLDTEGLGFRDVQRMRDAVARLSLDRLESTNTMLHDSLEGVKAAIRDVKAKSGLWETIEDCLATAACQPIRERWTDWRVRAMIGVCLYEEATDELPDTNPDAKEA